MDLTDIQQHIEEVMNKHNNLSVPEFEGYSPNEMHNILHFTFEENSPIKLKELSESDYLRIPILNQIKYLTNLIDKAGEIKLTNKGFLPTKIVADVYQQGFLKDKYLDKRITKVYKEADFITINLSRILIELSGLAKKRNGKLSLTKSSGKILSNNYELLRLIFLTFVNKFNWAYFDYYENDLIGQFGYGFSLILLSKYGKVKRLDFFYSKKYIQAYPQLLEFIEPNYCTIEQFANSCYSVRTFERFLDYFGLIKIEEKGKGFNTQKYITKTDLFDKFIQCTPHKNNFI